jgi:hypothetical protein
MNMARRMAEGSNAEVAEKTNGEDARLESESRRPLQIHMQNQRLAV